jgi:hypothetical protein
MWVAPFHRLGTQDGIKEREGGSQRGQAFFLSASWQRSGVWSLMFCLLLYLQIVELNLTQEKLSRSMNFKDALCVHKRKDKHAKKTSSL